TDSPAQAQAVAQRLRQAMARPPLSRLVARVLTTDDLVPPDQSAKIAEVERIRRQLTPAVRAAMDPEALAAVDELLGAGPMRPVGEADLPPALRASLRERDGSTGKVVLVYPQLSKALWQTESILAYADGLRQVTAGGTAARPPRVAGLLPLSAD